MSFLQRLMLLIIVILIISSISYAIIDIQSTTSQSIADKVDDEIQKAKNDLKIDREKLVKEKQISKSVENIDVFQLNVGGEIIITTRDTLTKIPRSILSLIFNGRWESQLQRDQNGNIFFDFNPILFRYLLDQLQIIEKNNSFHLDLPSQPSLVEPFKKMLRKLGLDQLFSLEENNIITLNVGGQIITNRRTTFIQVSNSTADTIVSHITVTHFNNQIDVFLDYDPKVFQHLINQLRKESFEMLSYLRLSLDEEKISFKRMLIDLSIFDTTNQATTTTKTTSQSSTTTKTTTIVTTTKGETFSFSQTSMNTTWQQNGTTIAGGNGEGNESNQLYNPYSIYIEDDNDQSIYIADTENHRIVEWKYDATIGQVVAGGNEQGIRTDQLNEPKDVIVDKKTDSLIICDRENKRVVRWPRRNGTNGQIIISGIECRGLTMDNNGDLYVSDTKNNAVRRWQMGETNGTLVAGGNGQGNQFNQLSNPTYLFVDKDRSVYVSDNDNHRVMKWLKDAKEGIVVAGGEGEGHNLTQLNEPYGVMVDQSGHVYVADSGNHRIMCWPKGSKEGHIIVGENGAGSQPNQIDIPMDLSFDRQGNLYVVDLGNNRVQKFEIDLN